MNIRFFRKSAGVRSAILSLAACSAFSAAASAAPGEFRDAPSHEQLALKRGRMEQEDPMKSLPPGEGADPAKDLPKDLISQSDFICFDGSATLVPKMAILRVPQGWEERVRFQKNYRIKGWLDFYPANRGWITTVEVSFAQAEGKEPLPEQTLKMISTSRNLVVAVHQGGPISVLPPRVSEEGAETASVEQADGK